MDRRKRERMARAAYRSKPRLMWQKLASKDKPRTGFLGTTEWDAGYYYTPYMPVMRDGSVGIIMAGATA